MEKLFSVLNKTTGEYLDHRVSSRNRSHHEKKIDGVFVIKNYCFHLKNVVFYSSVCMSCMSSLWIFLNIFGGSIISGLLEFCMMHSVGANKTLNYLMIITMISISVTILFIANDKSFGNTPCSGHLIFPLFLFFNFSWLCKTTWMLLGKCMQRFIKRSCTYFITNRSNEIRCGYHEIASVCWTTLCP